MGGKLSAYIAVGAGVNSSLSGGGALAMSHYVKFANATALAGGGTLSMSTFAKLVALANTSGSGSLGVTGLSQNYPIPAALAGNGALAASGFSKYLNSSALAGAGALSATTTAITLLDFTDTFNRANNTTPGAPWVNDTTYGNFAISGNMLVNTLSPTTGFNAAFYGPVSKDGMRMTVTMGVNSSSIPDYTDMFFEIRAGDSHTEVPSVQMALSIYGGVAFVEEYMVDAAGNPLGNNPATSTSFVIGDTFAVESIENNVAVYKNGAPILFDNDPTQTYPSGGGNRSAAIYVIEGAATVKLDQIRIQEIDKMPQAFSGRGTLSATATSAIIDDFNRADNATVAGGNWTAVAGSLGIIGNTLYPTGASMLSYGVNSGEVGSDDMAVTITLGAVGAWDWTTILLGCNGVSGIGAIALIAATPTPQVAIYLLDGWGVAGGPTQELPSLPLTVGDKLMLHRIGSVYSLVKNNNTMLMRVKIDPIDIPRDSSYRLCGAGGYNASGNYRRIDSWRAESNPAALPFMPFTEINIGQFETPVPSGTAGCYLTMIGGGGGGGSGRKGATSTARAGGCGGGGGGYLPRTFIPVANLGATYTTDFPGAANGGAAQTTASTNGNPGSTPPATQFSSGSTSIFANSGIGGNGGTTASAAGGAGGTVTGVAGGTSGTSGGNSGVGSSPSPAPTNTVGGGGGGGGGGADASNGRGRGGTGGTTNSIGGGLGGVSTGGAGDPGYAAVASQAGPGAGGGTASTTASFKGGAGTGYGAGGGGGSSSIGSASSGVGGAGGQGYIKVEWV